MQDIRTYQALDDPNRQSELANVVADIVFVYNELGSLKSDRNTSFLSAYIQSPAGNVAGKTRDAEYHVQDEDHEIIQREYQLLSLLARKEYLLCLIN
jgi:hypothetical protein